MSKPPSEYSARRISTTWDDTSLKIVARRGVVEVVAPCGQRHKFSSPESAEKVVSILLECIALARKQKEEASEVVFPSEEMLPE